MSLSLSLSGCHTPWLDPDYCIFGKSVLQAKLGSIHCSISEVFCRVLKILCFTLLKIILSLKSVKDNMEYNVYPSSFSSEVSFLPCQTWRKTVLIHHLQLSSKFHLDSTHFSTDLLFLFQDPSRIPHYIKSSCLISLF